MESPGGRKISPVSLKSLEFRCIRTPHFFETLAIGCISNVKIMESTLPMTAHFDESFSVSMNKSIKSFNIILKDLKSCRTNLEETKHINNDEYLIFVLDTKSSLI